MYSFALCRRSVSTRAIRGATSRSLFMFAWLLVSATPGCSKESSDDSPDVATTEKPAAVITQIPSEQPDIIFVTLDTTRADYIDTATMPFVTRFFGEGVTFTAAQSVFTETGPAHASLLTGLQPHQHGVTQNVAPFKYPARLPLAYYKNGYQTAAFVSSVPVRGKYGFNLGFEIFNDDIDPAYKNINMQRGGRLTIDTTIEWLGRRDSNKPLFLWVHLFDPHAPYDPPDLREGEEKVTRAELDGYLRLKTRVKRDVIQRVQALYRRELRFTDTLLEDLFAAIQKTSKRDILWSLVADHGEELFDHSNFCEHNRALYQSVLNVPLMVRFDGYVAQRRVDFPVNSAQLAPTILALTGLDPFPNALPPLPIDGKLPEAETIIVSRRAPSGNWRGGRASAVLRGNYKAIFFERGRESLLFDLGVDPGETRNLAKSNDALMQELRRALESQAPMILDPRATQMDAATRHQLIMNGYLQGDEDEGDEDDGNEDGN